MNNEKNISRLLNHLAEEIPANTDLWTAIRAKAQTSPRPSSRLVSLWGTRVAVMLLLLVVAGTAFAAYQLLLGFYNDRGIQQVEDLLTPLNVVQSNPDGNVQVTLLWAYADGHRITVAYQIDHDASLLVPTAVEGTLTDSEGRRYPMTDFLGVGGGGGSSDGENSQFGSSLNFEASQIIDNPQALDLQLTVSIGSTAGHTGGGSGSGGSGGGGGGSSSDSAPTSEVAPFDVSFDFKVPFIAARHSAETSVQTVDGVTMTVSDVSYAPSVTLARLCYSNPNATRQWRPALVVVSGDTLRPIGRFVEDPTATSDAEICGNLTLLEVTTTGNGLAFEIPYLHSEVVDVEQGMKAFSTAMHARGFEVTVTANQFSIDWVPDDLQGTDYYSVVQAIEENTLWDHMGGAWRFHFNLP